MPEHKDTFLLQCSVPLCKLTVNCRINLGQHHWWVMFGQLLCSSWVFRSKTFTVATPETGHAQVHHTSCSKTTNYTYAWQCVHLHHFSKIHRASIQSTPSSYSPSRVVLGSCLSSLPSHVLLIIFDTNIFHAMVPNYQASLLVSPWSS